MEVGPRDGLQNEKIVVETASKIAFVDSLVDAGCSRVEVTAFVNPRWIPPLADQAEVARGVSRKKGVAYAALVPNMRGYQNAIATHVDEVAFVLAATDGHNLKNINATTDEAFERYVEVAKQAQVDEIPFRGYVSCAFGCPYEGDVDPGKVADVVARFVDLGAYEISLGDTIGVGTPKQTQTLLKMVADEVNLDKVALHLHDTRGTALANIVVALEVGITAFDSAAGGLGGCPYAPGAAGNVATEDLVYLLDGMGVETGIDLDKLCDVSLRMEKILQRPSPSKVLATRRHAKDGNTG
ncbi:MAG: hydroxymethylglutaryl-CoA lyase [Deltaproteobacteria bacterium]|nr:hydroxymethylglutaryl-CoA lyase [Deltaproteobacteria bacterium]